jgi:ribonuclease T1
VESNLFFSQMSRSSNNKALNSSQAPKQVSQQAVGIGRQWAQGWIGKGVLSAALLGGVLVAGAFTRTEPAVTAPSMVQKEGVVALSALPSQGQNVYQRILAGGPFRYDKDGTVFGNRERMLPRQPRGYYREYTVPTPGSHDRGARRIVCGGNFTKRPETCFYTQDHYQSFQEIDPQR